MAKGLFGSKDKAKNQTVKGAEIHRTVQQSIPYVAAYANGILQTTPGCFSKTYFINDINFCLSDDDGQEELFSKYCSLLNSVSDADIEISGVNATVDIEEFKKEHFLPFKNDKLDEYRSEVNDILLKNLESGRKIASNKYITLTIRADNIDAAVQQFKSLDNALIDGVRNIGGSVAVPLGIEERLKFIRNALQPDCTDPLDCDMNQLKARGITTKELISPSSMKVMKDYMEIGDKFVCSLFVAALPSVLTTDFFSDINDISCNLVVGVHLSGVSQEKALKIVKNQITNINSNIVDQQKKASTKGYGIDVVSPDLEAAKEEAQDLREDLTKRNQKMFYASVNISVFADNLEDLEQLVSSVKAIGQRHMCVFKKASYQQEISLAASLPIGNNPTLVKHLLTTESAGLFIPYTSVNLSQKGGLYYGNNSVTHNMIFYDRLHAKNANGFILGTPGSGKSFAAKREILSVLLGTDADIYVVDPEREYTPLAEMLGGEIIRVSAGSGTYINPLDMDMQYADQDDPVTLKADFLCSICETAIGGRYGLTPGQKSIIDRCVKEVYKPYMEYMNEHPELTNDSEHSPTLVDFYERLLAQPEPEALTIALALELYCTGSFDVFSKKTNVNIHSRFVVYDIKDIGYNLRELGLQVCLNDIWNKTISNKAKGKRTWFYLDEFYLLTQNEASAQFLKQIYKRARKWGGVPTGMTQNVEDLLSSVEGRGILSNSGDFIIMMNQSPLDKEQLAEMFHISPSLQTYITNTTAGNGLLYTGRAIVPFSDNYPHDTKTFKVMTTDPNDIEIVKNKEEEKNKHE